MDDPELWNALISAGIGTASYLEIAWTACAVLGLLVTLFSRADTLINRRELRAAPDYHPRGPRAILIGMYMRRERVAFGTFAVFIWIGIGAMLAPPAIRAGINWQPISAALAFIVGELFIAGATVAELRDRYWIRHQLERHRLKMPSVDVTPPATERTLSDEYPD